MTPREFYCDVVSAASWLEEPSMPVGRALRSFHVSSRDAPSISGDVDQVRNGLLDGSSDCTGEDRLDEPEDVSIAGRTRGVATPPFQRDRGQQGRDPRSAPLPGSLARVQRRTIGNTGAKMEWPKS